MTAGSAPEESSPQSRRSVRVALVVLLLLVSVRAALPSLAAWGADRAARTYLGLDVEVGDVDLGLLRGRVVFEELSLVPPNRDSAEGEAADAPTPLLTWERAEVDLAWTELLAGRIHLAEVALRAPQVELARRADGSIDPLAGAAPVETIPEDEVDDGEAGLPISVDRFVVQAARLRIVEGADASELLALELDDVQLRDFTLEGGEVSLGAIGLRGPKLRVVRDFALRPTGPAVRSADPPVAAAPVTETPAAEVTEESIPEEVAATRTDSRPLIAEVEIDSAEFALLTGARDVRLVASLHAEQIARDTKATFPLKFSLEADEGTLELMGRMALSPFVFAGDLRWTNLPVPLLAVSLRPDLSEWVRSCRAGGEVSLDIDLGGRAGRKPSIRIAGNAEVSQLEILDPQDEALSVTLKHAKTKIENLTIPLDEGATESLQIVLADLHYEEPRATYTHPSDAIERLFRGPRETEVDAESAVGFVEIEPGDAAEPPPEVSRPVEILLRDVAIRNGSLALADESVTPNYEVLARDFTADLRGVSLGGPVAIESVDASFRSRGSTRVEASGRLGATSGEFDVDLDRVALPPLNGYAAAAGIEVVQGALSSDSKVRRRGEVWSFDNDLTLHDLKLDPQGSEGLRDSVGMPTDVLLALLRDTDGEIELPVEFSVGPGAGSVGISSSIIGALRQALVGAASIPLKSVGTLLSLSGGGAKVEAIPAVSGFPTFEADAADRVAGLAGLLDARPRLGISLVGSIGDGDRDGLAGRILAEELDSGGDLPKTVDGEAGIFARRRISKALRARARGEESPLEASDEELLVAYVEATEVPEDRFRELAQERAQLIRDDLVSGEGVSPERIRISEEMHDDVPGVDVEFFITD